MAAAVPLIGLALSAVGGVVQFVGQQKQAKEQKKAQRAQLAVQQEQNRRSRVGALREAQIRRAQTRNLGEAVGAGASSGIAGGISSLGSQFGAASGSSTQLSGLNADISLHSQKAADAAGLAQFGNSVSNFGAKAFSASGVSVEDLFGGQKGTGVPPINIGGGGGGGYLEPLGRF